MAAFIRENALITFLLFLVVVITGNAFLFMQSKNPQKNLKDWFMLKGTGESLGNPWKKETDQLNELSERVAALKNSTPPDIDTPEI